MARPISPVQHARDPHAELQSRLKDAPAEHVESLLSAYEVLQGLHDRGVLELLRGLLGSSDKVLEIAVDAARSPQAIRSMRNLILLANLLGEIDPEQLGALTRAVPPVLSETARHPEPPGLWKLMVDFLWNRDVRRALLASGALLKTFGRSLATPGGEKK